MWHRGVTVARGSSRVGRRFHCRWWFGVGGTVGVVLNLVGPGPVAG